MTREYRAPEIILNADHYDQKADVWSVGCMISELLTHFENPGLELSEKILFKGDSCFPLSPSMNNKDELN